MMTGNILCHLVSSFFLLLLLLFNYSHHHYLPIILLLPIHPPTFNPTAPLSFSMGPLYVSLDDPSPSFPCYPLPLSPLVTVTLLFITMALLLFCSLVCFADQVPLIGEVIWYFSCTTWLTSLSIMVSSSIHAVCLKGQKFLSFCCIVLHHVNIPQFFDPFIY